MESMSAFVFGDNSYSSTLDFFGGVYMGTVVRKVPVDQVAGADPFRPLAVGWQLLPAPLSWSRYTWASPLEMKFSICLFSCVLGFSGTSLMSCCIILNVPGDLGATLLPDSSPSWGQDCIPEE